MTNKLPEKLLLLRKHFGFSQQEIADKMGVNVTEYMGWENGRAICNLAQFKLLANIFQISLDDILKNTMDIVLPNLSLEDSIQIPFMKESEGVDLNRSQLSQLQQNQVRMPSQNTASLNKVSDIKESKKDKPVNTIHRIDVNQKPVKKQKQNNKKLFTILGAVGGIVLLFVAGYFFMNMNKDKDGLDLKLSQTDRLALTEKFSIYIQDNQSPKINGQGIMLTNFTDLVKIRAYNNTTIGLKSNGTLVAAGTDTYGQLDVKDIKDAVDVAMGPKHTAVALNDGKVVCIGDTSQNVCNVDQWENIVDVEAGNGFTLGIDAAGNVKVSGTISNASTIESQKSVKAITVGENEISFLTTSGMVTMVSYTSTVATNTSTLKNISQVAVGNGFVAGLGSDGKVQLITDDEELKKVVDEWNGVVAIAAANKTIVGYTSSGKMVGAGDNQYNQYINEEESTTKEKLQQVANLQINIEKTKVSLSWDKVEGADYYEVSINTNPVYTAKAVENKLSIDLSKLADGQTYVISVIASSNTDKELNSDPTTKDFNYIAPTAEPTPTPSFTLTIKYVYDDDVNSKIYQDYVMTYNVGDSYRVESPKIDGYEALRPVVEGTMGTKSEEITVRYKKVVATPEPTPTPTPTPTPSTGTETGGEAGGIE